MAKTKTQNGRDARTKKLVADCLTDATEESLQLVSKKMRYTQGSARYFLTKKQVALALKAFINIGGKAASAFGADLLEYKYLDDRNAAAQLLESRKFHLYELLSQILHRKGALFKPADLITMLKSEDIAEHDPHYLYVIDEMLAAVKDELSIEDLERIFYIDNQYAFRVVENIYTQLGDQFNMKHAVLEGVAPNVNASVYSLPIPRDDDRGMQQMYMVGYGDVLNKDALIVFDAGHFALDNGMNEEKFALIRAAGNPLSSTLVKQTVRDAFHQATYTSTEVGPLVLS